MNKEMIMAIRCAKRRANADQLQKVLTQYGCNIKMRLGLHEAGDVCSDEGLILLHLVDHDGEVAQFEAALGELEGIRYSVMEV